MASRKMSVPRADREACPIEYKNLKFLITEQPTDLTMPSFVAEMKKHDVSVVVRVCAPTYNTEELVANDIEVYDLAHDDGRPPPNHVIDSWFNLLRERFIVGEGKTGTVAVHCVAGLGRAPVMVALALMELGMDYQDVVEMIRSKRRGAINKQQLDFLGKYKAKRRLQETRAWPCCSNECCVM